MEDNADDRNQTKDEEIKVLEGTQIFMLWDIKLYLLAFRKTLFLGGDTLFKN